VKMDLKCDWLLVISFFIKFWRDSTSDCSMKWWKIWVLFVTCRGGSEKGPNCCSCSTQCMPETTVVCGTDETLTPSSTPWKMWPLELNTTISTPNNHLMIYVEIVLARKVWNPIDLTHYRKSDWNAVLSTRLSKVGVITFL
jgi:hypothetical protein